MFRRLILVFDCIVALNGGCFEGMLINSTYFSVITIIIIIIIITIIFIIKLVIYSAIVNRYYGPR